MQWYETMLFMKSFCSYKGALEKYVLCTEAYKVLGKSYICLKKYFEYAFDYWLNNELR